MRPSSELRDTCRVNVARCAAKIGHANCADHRPLVGVRSSNLKMLGWSAMTNVGKRGFQHKPTGREREAFRPTDLWYSTMKAGEMPHARGRFPQNEIFQASK
jgi:hypothetical protein